MGQKHRWDSYIAYLHSIGYASHVDLRGKHGSSSELEMHCGLVDAEADFAMLHPQYPYAVVFYSDGRVSEGCWTQYSTGNFCIS